MAASTFFLATSASSTESGVIGVTLVGQVGHDAVFLLTGNAAATVAPITGQIWPRGQGA